MIASKSRKLSGEEKRNPTAFLRTVDRQAALTTVIVLASEPVAEWFGCGHSHITQAMRRLSDRAPQAR